jgi:hypothetical protein
MRLMYDTLGRRGENGRVSINREGFNACSSRSSNTSREKMSVKKMRASTIPMEKP